MQNNGWGAFHQRTLSQKLTAFCSLLVGTLVEQASRLLSETLERWEKKSVETRATYFQRVHFNAINLKSRNG